MFHNIMAIELLVRDLTKCTAFYRDTLGLEVRESESTAGVADVDAAYEELISRGITFLRPPTDQSWGCVQPTLLIQKAISGRSTSPLKRSPRGRWSRSHRVLWLSRQG
jgi:hypothetical protein